MPEYRGIVNPATVEATPVFDWGAVIQGVTKSLTDSANARQASRDKLEKDTNDSITAMSKITLGKDESINKKLTDAVYNFKNTIGENAKLVREGKMPQKDYNIRLQNGMDAFNTINAVGKNSKVVYDKYIEDTKAGNLSAASDYLAQKLGLAASLEGKNIIMDPATGRGFIQGTDPNDLVDINWLNNEKNLFVPKVKLDAIMDANVDKIGKYALIGKVTSSGILSTDDAKERKGYEDYRKTIANGVIGDPMGALSVLADYGDINGVRYTPTINKAEADADKTGTKIYMRLNSTGNPEPVFTPKQLEAAVKIIENQVDQRVNVITTQVENVYRPPVFAPDRSEKPDETKQPSISIPADTQRTIKGKKYRTGSSIGVENVKIQKDKGVVEQIDKFGVQNLSNGKKRYFVEYTTYRGKDVTKGDETTTTDVISETKKLYSNIDGDKFLSKLNLIPNPQTGGTFRGIKDIDSYIEDNKATQARFNPDAYYNQQKSKK